MDAFTARWTPVTSALGDGTFDPQGSNSWGLFNPTQPAALVSPDSSLAGIDPSNPFTLLDAGYGNLNPATTPGGSANPVATATGLNQPDPSQGGSTNPGQSDPQAASVPGSLQNYFTRAVIGILGFIFVAAGLTMFGRGSLIPKLK